MEPKNLRSRGRLPLNSSPDGPRLLDPGSRNPVPALRVTGSLPAPTGPLPRVEWSRPKSVGAIDHFLISLPPGKPDRFFGARVERPVALGLWRGAQGTGRVAGGTFGPPVALWWQVAKKPATASSLSATRLSAHGWQGGRFLTPHWPWVYKFTHSHTPHKGKKCDVLAFSMANLKKTATLPPTGYKPRDTRPGAGGTFLGPKVQNCHPKVKKRLKPAWH